MKHETNLGEAYFDHYESCFGEFVGREVFAPHQYGPVIEILSYSNVMRGCRLYASLGLSHYAHEVGSVGEVLICAVPDDDLPYILASALFYLVIERMELGWGMMVGGIEAVAPDFVDRYQKPALYFSLPTLFPKHVRRVHQAGATGELYLATPITQAERDYFTTHGAVKFEDMLANSGVDTFELDRPSAI